MDWEQRPVAALVNALRVDRMLGICWLGVYSLHLIIPYRCLASHNRVIGANCMTVRNDPSWEPTDSFREMEVPCRDVSQYSDYLRTGMSSYRSMSVEY
jgi:hypothetical protein